MNSFERRGTIEEEIARRNQVQALAEKRKQVVSKNLAELSDSGVIGSNVAKALIGIHAKNEDGVCPVAQQVHDLTAALADPATVSEARREAALVVTLQRRIKSWFR